MSSLSTDAIRNRLRTDDLQKLLVVRPLLDLDGQAKLGQAAVDLRLGFEFCLVAASASGAIDEFGEVQSEPLSALYRREYVPFGAKIIIHPHQFVLAQSLEYIRLPRDLMAYVVGRSTWGRLGLIIATAIGVHPGFAGNITFELRNLGETPLALYPGQTVAQLFFHDVVNCDGAPHTDVASGAQYAGTTDMVPRGLSSETTHKTISGLIEHFRQL